MEILDKDFGNKIWVYLDKIDVCHLQYLTPESYVCHICECSYIYFYNKDIEMGFIVKADKD